MSKRSNFDRKDKDFYETPLAPVKALEPHLPKKFNFVDPCAGEGKIGEHLASIGFMMEQWWDCDKYPEDYSNKCSIKADATYYTYRLKSDFFITNPPWSRDILHPIIDNLAGQKPTWLLFDADWMHTKQSAEYMKYCVKVISIGRVKWFPDSKHVGKDNACWYLFHKNFAGQTEFYGR